MKPCVLLFALFLSSFGFADSVFEWTLPVDWRKSELSTPIAPVGAPALAERLVWVTIPEATTNWEITVSSDWEIASTNRPLPIMPPVTIGEASSVSIEDAQYYHADTYPLSPVRELGEVTVAGERRLALGISPQRWRGGLSRLEHAAQLQVRVAFHGRVVPRLTTSAMVSSSVRRGFVIISPPAFIALWQKYVAFREMTHPQLRFTIKNSAEIYNEFKGSDEALKIHHYIESIADDTDYVMLGAGCPRDDQSFDPQTMIPTRRVVVAGAFDHASDMYFACMDYKGGKEVWDFDGDGYYFGSKTESGYTVEASSGIDYAPDLRVMRFPLRPMVVENGESYSAERMMNGFIRKLRAVSSAQFSGRAIFAMTGDHAMGPSSIRPYVGDGGENRGYYDSVGAKEYEFYDGGVNISDPNRTTSTVDGEMFTRARNFDYFTNGRGNRATLFNFSSYAKNTLNEILSTSGEIEIQYSHGSERAANPLTVENIFDASGVYGMMSLFIPCYSGSPYYWPGTHGYGITNCLSLGEAAVLNPDGGVCAAFANSWKGWYSTYNNNYSQLLERYFFDHYTGSEACDTGTALMLARIDYAPNSWPDVPAGNVSVENIGYGDPLVTLYSQPRLALGTGDEWAFDAGASLVALTNGNQTVSLDDDLSCGSLVVTQSVDEVTALNGSGGLRVTTSAKLTGGTLKWNVSGGVGRGGLAFTESAGSLVCEGDAKRYFGAKFENVGEVSIAGSNVTLDFYDSVSSGVGKLSFTGSGVNTIRGIGKGDLFGNGNVSVTGGTLRVEAKDVAGLSDVDSVLFTVKNGRLVFADNPLFEATCFAKTLQLYDSVVSVECDGFTFGAKSTAVSRFKATSGDSTLTTTRSKLNFAGSVQIDVARNASLSVTAPMVSSSSSASLTKRGVGALCLDNDCAMPITVQGGSLSCGSSRCTISGALTLNNGTSLAIEIADGRVGGLTASSITVGSSVKLNFSSHGIAPNQGAYPIVKGLSVSENPFTITDLPDYATVGLVGGTLYLLVDGAELPESGDADYPIAYAQWSGASSVSSLWSDSANWVSGVRPIGRAAWLTVTGGSGEFNNDLTGITLGTLNYSATLGSSLRLTGQAVDVAAITNASSYSQTIAVPLSINGDFAPSVGAAGMDFAGGLTINGAFRPYGKGMISLALENVFSGVFDATGCLRAAIPPGQTAKKNVVWLRNTGSIACTGFTWPKVGANKGALVFEGDWHIAGSLIPLGPRNLLIFSHGTTEIGSLPWTFANSEMTTINVLSDAVVRASDYVEQMGQQTGYYPNNKWYIDGRVELSGNLTLQLGTAFYGSGTIAVSNLTTTSGNLLSFNSALDESLAFEVSSGAAIKFTTSEVQKLRKLTFTDGAVWYVSLSGDSLGGAVDTAVSHSGELEIRVQASSEPTIGVYNLATGFDSLSNVTLRAEGFPSGLTASLQLCEGSLQLKIEEVSQIKPFHWYITKSL